MTASAQRVVVLSDPQLDDLAERVVKRLRDTDDASRSRQPSRLVDAATVAAALGVSRDCVYAHADELGGERIGGGPRGRLRFDLDRALVAWTSRSHSKESHTPKPPAPTGDAARRRRQRMGSSPGLLPIRRSASYLDSERERS
ncbi:MAG TPA: hypothetical protein VIJ39_06960 [Solirubrobacteraceae bacterium]